MDIHDAGRNSAAILGGKDTLRIGSDTAKFV